MQQVDGVRLEPNRMRRELPVLHDWQDGFGTESHARRNPGSGLFRARDSEEEWDGERFGFFGSYCILAVVLAIILAIQTGMCI